MTVTISFARIALSLFNTLLLTWLGLTVLLSAERRGWGIWLGSGSLLLGATFFVAHTILLVDVLEVGLQGSGWWFLLGMAAVIALPLAWYVIMLWYAGFWDGESALRRRHSGWLLAVGAVMLGGLLALLAKALRALPVFNAIDRLMDIRLAGVTLDGWGFLLYVMLCCALALDAVIRPGPARRMLGEQARRRARPWLIGTSLALLATSFAVATAIIWTLRNTRVGQYYVLDGRALRILGQFDLLIMLLIAMAVLLVGQATAAYELFTGAALPRRGLRAQWQRALLLAAGLSVTLSLILTLAMRPIYSVLLTILLAALFLALAGWRTFSEAEQTMRLLRPFVASDRLWDELLTVDGATATDPPAALQQPFDALCRELLACERAVLIASGPFSTLVPPLTFGAVQPQRSWVRLAEDAPRNATVQQLDPAAYDGLAYALPLWRPQGSGGVLLIGPQRSGALYTRELLTIAQATAERLIDTLASAALARRLLQLQRERLVQTQLADRQTRRVLHDDVLPLLHTALLAASSGDHAHTQGLLADAHSQIANLLRELPVTTTPDLARLGLAGALERAIEQEFRGAFDRVAWQLGDAERVTLAQLSPPAAEIVYHALREAVRNAARHARTPGRPLTLTIAATRQARQLLVTVADDGGGPLRRDNGSGQGLALHSTLLSLIGGTLALDQIDGTGVRVTLTIPAANQPEPYAALI